MTGYQPIRGQYLEGDSFVPQGADVADFGVKFTSPVQYFVGICTAWNTLPTQPPTDFDKTWTFTKTSTAFNISCNGVELLTYAFDDSGDCLTTWSRDVEYIFFHFSYDSASDSYRTKISGKIYTGL